MNYFHKKLQNNVLYDYFYTFINNLNMSNSIWVLYLAYHGMSLMKIGILEGIYHITGLVCEIPSGAVADILGRKKTMLISRILMAVSCIIMLFSHTFTGFAISFIFQSMSGSFNSGSEEALVYDSLKLIHKEASYPAINGRINVLIEIAQGIATVAGGILAEFSYTYCYLTCIVIALLGLFPVLLMTEPTLSASETDRKKPLKHTHTCSAMEIIKDHFLTSREILKKDKKILAIIIFYATIFSAYNTMYFYGQQYFYDLGRNKIEIGIIMLFAGIFSCMGAFTSSRLYEKFGQKIPMLGTLLTSTSLIAFGFDNLYLSIGTLLIAGFFNSALYPIQSNTLNQRIPSAQRATLISVNSLFFAVFMIILFPLTGALADKMGLGLAFAALGIVVLAGILPFYKTLFAENK